MAAIRLSGRLRRKDAKDAKVAKETNSRLSCGLGFWAHRIGQFRNV